MVYTSLKFESEETTRSQFEPLQIQGRHGCQWLSFRKKVAKTGFVKRLEALKDAIKNMYPLKPLKLKTTTLV